jgi:hypothetical protein
MQLTLTIPSTQLKIIRIDVEEELRMIAYVGDDHT